MRFGFASRSAYLFKDGVCVMADYDGHTGDQAQQVIDFLDGKKSARRTDSVSLNRE